MERRILFMNRVIEGLEKFLELGGVKKDIAFLIVSGIFVVCSLLGFQPFPFDMAWIAIVLCGLPIVLEAIIGLITEFDIKADVLVSLALNFVAIILAIIGTLNPVVGALVHNAGSVLVITNSALLLKWRKRQ